MLIIRRRHPPPSMPMILAARSAHGAPALAFRRDVCAITGPPHSAAGDATPPVRTAKDPIDHHLDAATFHHAALIGPWLQHHGKTALAIFAVIISSIGRQSASSCLRPAASTTAEGPAKLRALLGVVVG